MQNFISNFFALKSQNAQKFALKLHQASNATKNFTAKIWRNYKEFFALFALCVGIFAFNVGLEWIKFTQFKEQKHRYLFDAKVLQSYEKTSKKGRRYRVLKLQSDDFSFYTTTKLESPIRRHHRLDLRVITTGVGFKDFLSKSFYMPSYDLNVISADEVPPNPIVSYFLSQHTDEKIREFYGALFFALPVSLELRTDVNYYGIAHLIAISGYHIALIFSLAFFVLMPIYSWLQCRYFPYRNARFDLSVIIFVFLFFYAQLLGFVPSYVRSLVMALVGFYLLAKNVKILSFVSLFFSVSLCVALFPQLLFSVGFLFSVMGVFFIFLYMHHFSRIFKKFTSRGGGSGKALNNDIAGLSKASNVSSLDGLGLGGGLSGGLSGTSLVLENSPQNAKNSQNDDFGKKFREFFVNFSKKFTDFFKKNEKKDENFALNSALKDDENSALKNGGKSVNLMINSNKNSQASSKDLQNPKENSAKIISNANLQKNSRILSENSQNLAKNSQNFGENQALKTKPSALRFLLSCKLFSIVKALFSAPRTSFFARIKAVLISNFALNFYDVLLLNVWTFFAMIVPVLHYFPLISFQQILAIVLSYAFVIFYPLVLFLHFVGFGGLLDGLLSEFFAMKFYATNLPLPLWMLLSYIVLALLSISNRYLALFCVLLNLIPFAILL